MARSRRLLPVAVAIILLFSWVFVDGSIAQPLGEGLMQHFGLDSSGTNGGTEDAAFQFGLPVTVMNDDTRPVPVTLPGTLETRDAEPAGAQPYQYILALPFDLNEFTSSQLTPNLPDGKRLIIRYVSGKFQLTSDELLTDIQILSNAGGNSLFHRIPFTKVGTTASGDAVYMVGTETWIEADPGTHVSVAAERDSDVGTATGLITISGYLIDAPETAAP